MNVCVCLPYAVWPSYEVASLGMELGVTEARAARVRGAKSLAITDCCFSTTRDPIDNLTSQNDTYEYEVETRIGGQSIRPLVFEKQLYVIGICNNRYNYFRRQ